MMNFNGGNDHYEYSSYGSYGDSYGDDFGNMDGLEQGTAVMEAQNANSVNEYDRQLTAQNTHEQAQLQHFQSVQGDLETFIDISNQQQDVNRQLHIAHREVTEQHAKAVTDARMERMLKRAEEHHLEQERKLQAKTEAMLVRADIYKRKREMELASDMRKAENQARIHALGQADIVNRTALLNTRTMNINSQEKAMAHQQKMRTMQQLATNAQVQSPHLMAGPDAYDNDYLMAAGMHNLSIGAPPMYYPQQMYMQPAHQMYIQAAPQMAMPLPIQAPPQRLALEAPPIRTPQYLPQQVQQGPQYQGAYAQQQSFAPHPAQPPMPPQGPPPSNRLLPPPVQAPPQYQQLPGPSPSQRPMPPPGPSPSQRPMPPPGPPPNQHSMSPPGPPPNQQLLPPPGPPSSQQSPMSPQDPPLKLIHRSAEVNNNALAGFEAELKRDNPHCTDEQIRDHIENETELPPPPPR
ncbi:hypothetical protein BLS_005688 [Venturia inaequalis]|uniref:Uncharacterized protein n=1 Tax=Venturia inaequalis TaxID=5025 RepID=A0A8H3Z9W9_VENIN|nr:hypothetical protein BLS_005688 [Venturia inaequalis]